MKLSIIIPVYNEQDTIIELVRRVRAVALPPNVQKEIIVVDDGSTDASRGLILEQSDQYGDLVSHISIINLGKGAATRFGFYYSTGDILLIQDADLELDPTEYSKLIQPILAGETGVVYGSRFLKPSTVIPLKTRLANWFLTSLTNFLFGSHLSDMETAYKAFRREIISQIRLRRVGFDFEPEVTAKHLQLGFKIVEVPISYLPRTEDQGKKISIYDGLDAISTLVKCWLFPRPTNLKLPGLLAHDEIGVVLPYVHGKLLVVGSDNSALVNAWRCKNGDATSVDVFSKTNDKLLGELRKSSLDEPSFDTVIMRTNEFKAVGDCRVLMEEVCQVLSPGGRLIMVTMYPWPRRTHLNMLKDNAQSRMQLEKQDLSLLPSASIRQLLHEAGFDLVAEKTFGLLGHIIVRVGLRRLS